jgi:hypothetical protein
MYSKELSTVAFGVTKSSMDDRDLVRGETGEEGEDMGDNELLEMYEDDLDIEKFFSTMGQLGTSLPSASPFPPYLTPFRSFLTFPPRV